MHLHTEWPQTFFGVRLSAVVLIFFVFFFFLTRVLWFRRWGGRVCMATWKRLDAAGLKTVGWGAGAGGVRRRCRAARELRKPVSGDGDEESCRLSSFSPHMSRLAARGRRGFGGQRSRVSFKTTAKAVRLSKVWAFSNRRESAVWPVFACEQRGRGLEGVEVGGALSEYIAAMK